MTKIQYNISNTLEKMNLINIVGEIGCSGRSSVIPASHVATSIDQVKFYLP